MRILWLSGNPSLYTQHKKGYNSGGWIGALETIVCQQEDIELAVAFIFNDDKFKVPINRTVYYPINLYNSRIAKLMHALFYESYDKIELEKIKKVVEDFKPDIIHVWGTEISFGLITKHTNIPVIIHIQGILNPVFNALLIPGTNKNYYLKNNAQGILRRLINSQNLRFWKHNTKREIAIFQNCHYFMGRTHWDKNITALLAPNSEYFYCNELLRTPFYNAKNWQPHYRQKLIITSVLSNPTYKGMDLVLKCANILKHHSVIDFEWNIWGITECSFAEKLTGIKAQNVQVKLNGIANAEKLISELLNSDMFVHTSYIDNSPNSVCEAQFLGIPIISTNVGGIRSLIKENESGILVPSNDPYYLASQIIKLFSDKTEAIRLGIKGRIVAKERHNPTVIINALISIYKILVSCQSLIDG